MLLTILDNYHSINVLNILDLLSSTIKILLLSLYLRLQFNFRV